MRRFLARPAKVPLTHRSVQWQGLPSYFHLRAVPLSLAAIMYKCSSAATMIESTLMLTGQGCPTIWGAVVLPTTPCIF